MNKLYTIVAHTRNTGDANLLKQCIDSIKLHGSLEENEYILVVDSNSPQKKELYSVVNLYAGKVKVHSELNFNYEAGAWLKAYQSVHANRYIFLHDCCVLVSSIDHSLLQDISIYKPFDSWTHEHGGMREWVQEKLNPTPWSNIPQSFTMVQGSIFAAKREILDKLYTRGLQNILPANKLEAMNFERLLGIVLTLEGYEMQLRKNFLPVEKHFLGRT